MSEDDKIQIVAFSTNDTYETPNDVINIFLNKHTHSILKKSRHAIAFSTVLPETIKSTKIMVCSVLNLTREYTGITDVNCYMLFIDLEKEDSKEKVDSILAYAKDYCDLNKKFFVLAMNSGNKDAQQTITEADIKNTVEKFQKNFQYIQLNLEDTAKVSSAIMDIFIYSSKHPISGSEIDKDAKNAGSCNVF